MRRTFVGFSTLIVAACAGRLEPNYSGTLSAGRGVPAADKASTFAIAPTGQLTSETIAIVRSGLEARGMKPVAADQADVIVNVELGIGAPVTVSELTSIPLYGRQSRAGYVTQRPVGTDKNGRTTYTPVTVAGTTTENYVGEYYYCAATTVYDKRLRVSARPTGSAPGAAAWDVSVAVRDNVKEPSKYAPMLARAAISQVDADSQVATPVTIVNGGRTVKARKVSAAPNQGTQVSAPGVVRQNRGSATQCANDPNPTQAIRNAGCVTPSIGLPYPAVGISPFAQWLAIASCAPGVVGRDGVSRGRQD